MQLDSLFERLWRDYVAITPQAQRIHDLFTERGEHVVNDHVALRSFDLRSIALDALGEHVTALGYVRDQTYRFPEKKLLAESFLHPDPSRPRIFLSALQVDAMGPASRELISRMVRQVDPALAQRTEILCAGRAWDMPSSSEYRALLAESEYAAWLSVHGLRANHFTISVNHLRRTPELREVVDLIKSEGYTVNSAGGEIKGSPETLLEQAATVADHIDIRFADGAHERVPSCYYEFAKRYRDRNGELFQGFVPASAERLFESTNTGVR